MKIETVFQVVAVALAIAAAYFLWTGQKDGAFASFVLGCVAFFFSVRFQVKARNKAREIEKNAENQSSEKPRSSDDETPSA